MLDCVAGRERNEVGQRRVLLTSAPGYVCKSEVSFLLFPLTAACILEGAKGLVQSS